MATESVRRRERRSPIERARKGADARALWTGAVVAAVWFVLVEYLGDGYEIALLIAASLLALAFALLARLHEPEDRRDSVRWQIYCGLAFGCIGVAAVGFERDFVRSLCVTLALVFAVWSILGEPRKPAKRERSETAGSSTTFR